MKTFRNPGCPTRFRNLVPGLLAVLLPLATPALYAQGSADKDVLKVCADPYMLPFSNREEQGYENKIAELFASKLDARVKYKFFPQRYGFIRNTLRSQKSDGSYECDLVITVPENFELAATTKPYYTSTYLLAYRKDLGIGSVSSPAEFADAVKGKDDFKMGLADRGPAQLWVFRNNLMGNIVPYQGMPGDPKHNPGELLMKDLAAGKIDAAIVWGPTAGYYAKQLRDQADIGLIRMHDSPTDPNMRFEYSIAMAVRYGEKTWKDKVEQLIRDNKDEIGAILKDYGVPLLPLKVSEASDDDD